MKRLYGARPRVAASVLAVAVALVAVGGRVVRADPSPSLPPVSPQELLTSSLDALARPYTISGDVSTTIDLGLPELPSSIGGAGGPLSLVIGRQHYKVWHSPGGVRVAHILDFAEQDLVANSNGAWLWDSSSMTAVHLSYPSDAAPPSQASAPSAADITSMARAALDAVRPYATIAVVGTGWVAGRPVYRLVLTPTSSLTRVGEIVAAIDAETRLPLDVQAIPRGTDRPAIEAGFTSVSFDPINASMFTFAPPPGATVHQAAALRRAPGDESPLPSISPSEVRLFGSGFDLRVAYRLDAPLPKQAAALLPYSGSLASVIAVDRGDVTWILAGFVDISTLQNDANSLP